MGDWRTVRVVGTFDPNEGRDIHQRIINCHKHHHDYPSVEVHALRYHPKDVDGWLRGWERGSVDDTFMLWERNFTPRDIFNDLWAIERITRSFDLSVHCGGEHDSNLCVATVRLANNHVSIGPPDVPFIDVDLPEGLEPVLLPAVRAWLDARPAEQREDWEKDAG